MRAVLTAVAVLLTAAAPAAAHFSAGSRVHNARHVATAVVGQVCGASTLDVTIVRRDLPRPVIGRATSRIVDGARTGCLIELDDRPSWTTYSICATVVHEYLHLNGYRAEPGTEHTSRDQAGRLVRDFHHSRNPRSLMHPTGPSRPYRRCLPDRIRRAAASHPTP